MVASEVSWPSREDSLNLMKRELKAEGFVVANLARAVESHEERIERLP